MYTVGIIGLAIGIASTALAQTTANGPYYATPSWDQTLPSSTRFIILSNMGGNAVLDRETGLVWEKVPSTQEVGWFAASDHCLQLSVGGRKGWRLPTVEELASLVDPTQSIPALPSGHPFTVQSSSSYWSATTFASDNTNARTVSLFNGTVNASNKSITINFVWCVRGGQGVDAQ